ncbi:uncharacterized protein PHACADRAFT_262165 [Phanerochaete carnosa HHB-10118-sp]|uniref:G-patch domain-containing protein n=1 Tax=Phanerochaete carnosa (strain HHB-10118-sp) TaxID=650164 RepID=K5VKC6_PHACS|nr:uncharacterized protein PHACADRAFT_262165 [Phanerochaete carnosa HHB-10118-sp]EKM51813.1 hypothetical protein PHACADRAFT_262165 [Phanerochaete carnosa HHB-10118-sp]
MATVAHVIRSHYDPKDRETLEIATGQTSEQHEDIERDDVDIDLAWQTESAFSTQRRVTNAPKFVKAVVSYDEINDMMGLPKHLFSPPPKEEPKTEIAGWYRSLTNQVSSTAGPISSVAPPRASTAPLEATASSRISTPAATFVAGTAVPTPYRRPDKNNWFITRALQSEPVSSPSTPPTLADILAREPPPPADKAVKPPVFLALGPFNKGWGMLQQQGWAEGEGLGATASRQTNHIGAPARAVAKGKGKEVDRSLIKREEHEVQLDADGEISMIKTIEVVDLTLSDSDSETAEEVEDEESAEESPRPSTTLVVPDADAHSKPLLTPIATVLKSDRLGIGLKAKTTGPYKESKKRITHNQAALARHVREAEEMRRLKALVGRGTRSFARLAKADSEHRRQLLASLNAL